MSIIQGTSKAAGGAGYEIDQSIRFNDNDSAFLARTPSASNRKTWTWSAWVKRANLFNGSVPQIILSAGDGGTNDFVVQFGQSDDTLRISDYIGGTASNLISTQLFRDIGAWYHFVLAYDTTQGTAANRIKLYLNGSQVTAFGTAVYPSLNADMVINSAIAHNIGRGAYSSNGYFSGYMAEINFVDGTALAPTAFGETNDDGVWVPIRYVGSYGTEGYFIDGRDSSDLGDDESGNNNDFTSSGLATTDQMSDTPTNNFCTLNSVEPNWGGAVTLSDGNLALAGTAATVWNNAVATFKTLPSTGKWIWASEPNTSGGGQGDPWIVNETGLASRNNYVYIDANGWETTFDTSSVHTVLNNGAGRNASFSYGAGDFNVVCFDADSKKLWFGVYDVSAGTLQFHDGSTGLTGDPGAGTNPTFTLTGNEFSIGFATYTGRGGNVDFGQSDLLSQFTAPTDFKTLCTANLPTPSITDGSAYMQTLAYASTGTSTAFVQDGNSQFEPGLVWVKSRTGANNHLWFDQVRGATKFIRSDTTNVENTVADTLTAFNSNGFTAGADSVNWGINYPGRNNVAWMWAANGAGSSNTDGSLASTVSANTAAGFSIVTATPGISGTDTIGHGLGVAPKMIIGKNINLADNWHVYHDAISPANEVRLNTTSAATTTTWQSASTSSVFQIKNGSWTNGGQVCLFYCFAEIPGYSSIGSYKGNSSTDGTFVYTGFRPSMILWKQSTGGNPWGIRDTARDPFNVAKAVLRPSGADAETTASSAYCDILSNGFKLRATDGFVNNSASTYIYMAFAEHPFGGDGVAPATAR